LGKVPGAGERPAGAVRNHRDYVVDLGRRSAVRSVGCKRQVHLLGV